ncbi:MAG: hypothetical protein ACP5NV_01755 [Candidatus Woesearchaeota archaeon]
MTFESITYSTNTQNAKYIDNVLQIYHYGNVLKKKEILSNPEQINYAVRQYYEADPETGEIETAHKISQKTFLIKMKEFIPLSRYIDLIGHFERYNIHIHNATFYMNTEGEYGFKKWMEQEYKNKNLQNIHVNSKEAMHYFEDGSASLKMTGFFNRFISKYHLLEPKSFSDNHAIYRLEIIDITKSDKEGFIKILKEIKNHTYFLSEGVSPKDLFKVT